MLTAREIIAFCLSLPASYEDYPFGGDWTVMRHGGNHKSFALIYRRNGHLCINLKCEPMRADFLRQALPAVTPAYHMNKTHWNTVTIDGSLKDGQIFEMISHSYDLIRPKPRKQKCSKED